MLKDALRHQDDQTTTIVHRQLILLVLHLQSNIPSSTNENQDRCTLKPTAYDAVKKEINNLKNDCPTGLDTIPVKYLKPVSEYIASPITNINTNCIKT